jgi:YidC/Oxa1 family membrane protein insertase
MGSIMSIIYTAISWILLEWHSLWDAAGVGRWLATDWEWTLAIVFLVLTARVILFPVVVKQIKSQRAMQALQPQIKALQEKYKGDRQGLQQAQMELMRKEKANPLMGCLPLLIQAPIFIGVFHVLRHLKPTQPIQNRSLYGWTVGEFNSASHAKLFGAPIAASIKSSNADLIALHTTRANVTVVAAVLIAIMIITTYMTSRQMILRTGRATDPTQRMMQNLMMYFIPLSLLVSGSIFPIGSVIYYVTTNFFSLGQQYYVLRKFPPPPMSDTPGPSLGSMFGNRKAAAEKAALAQKSGSSARTGSSTTRTGSVAKNTSAAKNGSAAKAGGSVKAGALKAGAAAKNGSAPKNGTTPAPEVRPAGPKVGAKPINPKKGSPKR